MPPRQWAGPGHPRPPPNTAPARPGVRPRGSQLPANTARGERSANRRPRDPDAGRDCARPT
eukprot:8501645-Lingulodinium_polyedra.AAC.1